MWAYGDDEIAGADVRDVDESDGVPVFLRCMPCIAIVPNSVRKKRVNVCIDFILVPFNYDKELVFV
jgi:hypothetical protein